MAAHESRDRPACQTQAFIRRVVNGVDFPHDAHRAVLTDFLDAIEQDRDPVVTGEEALASQRLITDILASASLPA
jgi:predicted dehydrogenase